MRPFEQKQGTATHGQTLSKSELLSEDQMAPSTGVFPMSDSLKIMRLWRLWPALMLSAQAGSEKLNLLGWVECDSLGK